MSTLDDRILGEKLQYYCDSSDDEESDPENVEEEEEKNAGTGVIGEECQEASSSMTSDFRNWEGSSSNTGPKGVLKDWQRYRQLQTEQRREQARERVELTKKLAMTCRSHLDDEKEKKEKEKDLESVEADEDFLLEYIAQRMEELMAATTISSQRFGQLIRLETGDEFLEAVDKETKDVTVVVHLDAIKIASCQAMNGCLQCLASEYPHVKFCALTATAAGVSSRFRSMGLPALLVYKAGQMIGNFVCMADEFGSEDFFAGDVESFLIENGMIADRSLVPPTTIRCLEKGDDSDLSLDE